MGAFPKEITLAAFVFEAMEIVGPTGPEPRVVATVALKGNRETDVTGSTSPRIFSCTFAQSTMSPGKLK